MKRILLPTDFSDNSYEAIRYALLIFKDIKCTFYLLHTYTPPVYQTEYLLGSPGHIGLGDAMYETSETQLERLKTRLQNEYKNSNHAFMVHIAFNTLVTEVMETIESEAIDIVVMGTRGATGAKEILFGTNTVHVIKKAKCPVIAVPPNYQYVPPRVILFPTDYEIKFQKKELEPLLTLVDQHRTKVNVMHVSTGYDLTPNQKEHKKGLKKLLGSHGFFHDLPNNNIIDAINGFQVEEKINLLVMVQNKHTFLERLFIEPVIKKIGFHILTPFMVIPQL